MPATGQRTYRVANVSFGATSPPERQWGHGDVRSWARWDAAPGRTIYSADTAQFAYQEVLAYQADSLRGLKSDDVFTEPDEPEDQPGMSVLDHIAREWEASFMGFGPGKVPARWRTSRQLHTVTLPDVGWFIDITHQDSLTAINRAGGPIALDRRATTADLTGEDRDWTCRLATVLRRLTLDDGSLPHGIRYQSKHGANGGCWSLWMRQVDLGLNVEDEPFTASEGADITEHDPELKAAADHLGVTVY